MRSFFMIHKMKLQNEPYEFIKKGKGMLITTSNPMMINSLKRNPSWAMTAKNRKNKGNLKRSYDRITASFQYVSRETTQKTR